MPDNVILVTGAGGLVGRSLVNKLAQTRPDSRIIAVTRNRKSSLASASNVERVEGDLKGIDFWRSFGATVTHVVHLAAVIPWRAKEQNRLGLLEDNLAPIVNLIALSSRWPALRQIVYASSISVYSPSDCYASAKLAGEHLLHSISPGTTVTSLRYSSIYGVGQSRTTVLPMMIDSALNKGEITVCGSGNRTQDFIYCEDASTAIISAIKSCARGSYNIGCGRPVTMSELARAVSDLFTDGKANIVYKKDAPDGESHGYDITLSRARLGFEPEYDIERGLKALKEETKRVEASKWA